MNARACLALLLWITTSSSALAAPAASTRPKAVPATVAKVAQAPQAPKAPKASARKAAAPAKAKAAKPDGMAAKGKGAEGPRTLQDIHIEGEIPVPQVLFITARDQRRFLDLQHRRYLKTSQQVGEQTVFPSWIGVTGNHPTPAGKENPQ